MDLSLPDLNLIECQFHLMLAQDCAFPRHLGAMLRGGIALLLKRTVCLHPQITHCRDCQLRHRCVYPAIFEPAPPPDSEALSLHQDIPLPLILRLSPDWQPHYQAGDSLSFGLILVGSAIRYLPYLVAAVEHLGHTGLGPERVRFRLAKVTEHHPDSTTATVYEAGLMYDVQAHFSTTCCLTNDATCTTLTTNFLTPTRLKHADQFLRTAPPFHVIIRTLLRRLSSLSYFHAGQRWDTDYRGWIERAEQVSIAHADVQWVDWERYSTRQERHMSLGGIIGQVTYTGDVAPFVPLLRLAEWIHLGKGAVFGNGRVRLQLAATEMEGGTANH